MSSVSGEFEMQLRAGLHDEQRLGEVLDQYRERLRRMVRLRLDRRVQARVDASDVIQDAFVDISARLRDYLANPSMPFFLWVRFLVGQKILELHRHHLNVQARDAAREVSLHQGTMPPASSASLAWQLVDGLTEPIQAAIKAEMRVALQTALNSMDVIDREILALRHFEQLSMAEAAEVLGIQLTAACNRYVRALKRLKEHLPEAIWE